MLGGCFGGKRCGWRVCDDGGVCMCVCAQGKVYVCVCVCVGCGVCVGQVYTGICKHVCTSSPFHLPL